MATKKLTTRPLRITTPVNALEKQRAERIAKDEGFSNVGDLVRQLLAKHHGERLKKAKAKKARAAKKKGSLRSLATSPGLKSRNSLPLGTSSRTAKPSRASSTRKRTGSSTASSASKKTLNRGAVAVASSKVGRPSSRSTKGRTAANR